MIYSSIAEFSRLRLYSLGFMSLLSNRCLLIASFCFVLSSCGFNPEKVDIKPNQEPMYNFTQSSRVLDCLGNLIDSKPNVPPIDVFVSNIPDHTVPSIETGFLTKNAVMMATTALSRINSPMVQVVGQNGADPRRQQIQVLGAFTELNRTTQSRSVSGDVIIPGGVRLQTNADKDYNHIAIDLAMSQFNRIVPGTSVSVSVWIHGNSGDATITYDDDGDFAAIAAGGFTAQEGLNSGQRLLVETAIAIMISRYYQVDIKKCLKRSKNIDATPIRGRYDYPVFPDLESYDYMFDSSQSEHNINRNDSKKIQSEKEPRDQEPDSTRVWTRQPDPQKSRPVDSEPFFWTP